jgi:Protein of unknown function (DUF2934)
MDNALERRIRERAYEIWNTTGRPDGRAEQHWLFAEREVLAMLVVESPAPQPAPNRRPRSRATPTTARPQPRAVAH